MPTSFRWSWEAACRRETRAAALVLAVFDDPKTCGFIPGDGDRGEETWAKRDHCANHRSRSHDVSHRNGDVGAWRRDGAGNMRSMIRMAPPQSGQTRLASLMPSPAGAGVKVAVCGLASLSTSRARHDAIFSAR